jgi:oligogalacturonide lyase
MNIKKYMIIPVMAVMQMGITVVKAQSIPVLETGKNMPHEWIDKLTGHRVVRLVDRPGTTNGSFYFNNYCYIPQSGGKGDLMVFSGSGNLDGSTTPPAAGFGGRGGGNHLFTINLKTKEIKQLTFGRRGGGEMVCPKTSEAFYQVQDSVFAISALTGKERLVCVLDTSFHGRASTVNADGTYLAAVRSMGNTEREITRQFPQKSGYFNRIYDAHIEHRLYTIDTKTGAVKEIHRENEWTNHLLFSPVDPNILSYCHEGPWQKNDRIWNINIQTNHYALMHARTVINEIAGHEFFGSSGEHEWFDLQKPVSKTFYLAAINMKTGKEDRCYQMERNEWSIHFNVTKDEKLFCGDGGDPGQVAKAPDGQYIYLFRPEGDRFKSEKLVNMKNHDYHLEPNVRFTPDGKWVIFNGNFEGTRQIYAVEVAKYKS